MCTLYVQTTYVFSDVFGCESHTCVCIRWPPSLPSSALFLLRSVFFLACWSFCCDRRRSFASHFFFCLDRHFFFLDLEEILAWIFLFLFYNCLKRKEIVPQLLRARQRELLSRARQGNDQDKTRARAGWMCYVKGMCNRKQGRYGQFGVKVD